MPHNLAALRASLLRSASSMPWAMEREAMDSLLSRLAVGQLNIRAADVDSLDPVATGQPQAAIHPATERAAARREGAVAVIQVSGIIATRATFMDYIMGLNVIPPHAIAQAQEAAVQDADVKAVVTVWDTPGGITGGVPEAFDRMFALRGNGKPMISQVTGQCGSAGYWLASAAEEFDATPTALSGSIGVYIPHVDLSGAYAQEGVVKSYIDAPQGGHKVEGNDSEPLDESARAHIQEIVDDCYGMFVRDVARGRGVAESVVRSEQFGMGRVYMAQRAQERGMIDRVRTLSETLAAYGAGTAPAAPSPERRGRPFAMAQAEARLRGIDV